MKFLVKIEELLTYLKIELLQKATFSYFLFFKS